MRSYALETITSPVSVDQLRSWLAYPDFTTDESSLAENLLKGSAELVVTFIGQELKPRKRRLELPEWPTLGTKVGGLRPIHKSLADRVTLPFGPILEVTEVRVDGEVQSTDDFELVGNRIEMTPADDVEIDYKAGYDDKAFFLPEELRHAVLVLATWKWHHRGDAGGDALLDSGARSMLIPFKRWSV